MVPTPLSFIVGGIGLFILKKNFKSRRRLSKLSRMLKRVSLQLRDFILRSI